MWIFLSTVSIITFLILMKSDNSRVRLLIYKTDHMFLLSHYSVILPVSMLLADVTLLCSEKLKELARKS